MRSKEVKAERDMESESRARGSKIENIFKSARVYDLELQNRTASKMSKMSNGTGTITKETSAVHMTHLGQSLLEHQRSDVL